MNCCHFVFPFPSEVGGSFLALDRFLLLPCGFCLSEAKGRLKFDFILFLFLLKSQGEDAAMLPQESLIESATFCGIKSNRAAAGQTGRLCVDCGHGALHFRRAPMGVYHHVGDCIPAASFAKR